MGEVEFLVKLRDGADKIMEGAALQRDATNEYLETMAPVDVRELGDFDTLNWTKKEVSNPYEQAKHEENKTKEFDILQKKLQDHRGFWQTKTCKFWFHMGDESIIDRRKTNA